MVGASVEIPQPRRIFKKTPVMSRLTTGNKAPHSKHPEIASVRFASSEQTLSTLVRIVEITLVHLERQAL